MSTSEQSASKAPRLGDAYVRMLPDTQTFCDKLREHADGIWGQKQPGNPETP